MADVKLVISALDQTKAAIDSAKRNMEGLGNTVEQAKDAIAGYAKGLVGLWAVSTIYEYGKEMALMTARYETLGVSMTVVGRNAGYTGEQMEAAATAMQRSGISMVESRQQAMRLVQAHIDLANSQKLARIAQDAAVIGNMNSSEAFAAMIHGISTGQPEVLRTIGLNVSMEQSYKVMAATLGKHVDQLTQNEKTQGILNAVMLAGVDIAGTYEAAMDTAGKQINSMQRYTDDLKTVQGEVFTDVLTTAVMAFTDHLKGANDEAKALAANNELKTWGEGITDVLAGLADNANNAYQAVKVLGLTGAMVKAMGDTTPLDFAGRSAIKDGYDADIAAAFASEDRFTKALSERRAAVADKATKAQAETLAKDAAYTTAMNAYAEDRKAGLMSEAQYVKTVQTVYQALRGDNHVYRDTLATTPKATAANEYDKLMQSISEKTALQNAEATSSDKLNDADKLKIDLYDKIDAGVFKLSLSKKLLLDASLDEYDTAIKLNAAHVAEEKATFAASEAHNKYIAGLVDGLAKYQEESAAIAEANDRMGLNKEAIAAMDAAKLDSKAVTLDLMAIKMLDKNLDEAQYNIYKAQADELRNQAQLKRTGAAKGAALDAADAANKMSEDAAKSLHDDVKNALSTAFRDSKDPVKAFGDALGNVIFTRVTNSLADAMATKFLDSSIGTGLLSIFGLANGGIMSDKGSMPLHTYSKGGIATGPQLAVFGEGRMHEAYVPLPDGRSIPVNMKGGGQPIVNNNYFTIGDVASVSMVKQAVSTSQKQIVAAFGRSQNYGGAIA